MQIKFMLLSLFILQNVSKAVLAKFSIKNSERSLKDELQADATKNRKYREYKTQSKEIHQQNNELNEKIDSEAFILNIKSDGLFFEHRSVIESCSPNGLLCQKQPVSSTIKKEIIINSENFYLKKLDLINKILGKYNRNSTIEKFRKVTFHKKKTHEALVYNLELSEKLSQLEDDEKNKNRLLKINKILKKQLLLYYLNKKFKKSDIFATEFNPNKLESEKIFIKWINDICKNSNFDQIIQQAKRSSLSLVKTKQYTKT